jgi:hypothetical protein
MPHRAPWVVQKLHRLDAKLTADKTGSIRVAYAAAANVLPSSGGIS